MAWITVPNEVVIGFKAIPIKGQKLNSNLEALFKPLKCPVKGCEEVSVVLDDFREHIASHNLDIAEVKIVAVPDIEDTDTAHSLMHLLLQLQDDAELRRIRKPIDSFNITETWRRVQLAISRKEKEIRLKKDQYDWLHQLLDRKLPIEKAKKEAGEEQQTVGMSLYGADEWSVRQAYKTLPEREKLEQEPESVMVGTNGRE